MSIFGGLGQQNLADSAIDPKRLFRALSKPAGSRFQFPYDIQTEVWDKWYKRRDERDLIIKMNTGSGKTVIGLLVLKASLNERKGPAVYLVPDRQLKSQVEATATELGIAWESDPNGALFRQGQAVLIATVHTVYNGFSKFGVRGAAYRKIEVGTIVIDDAHACIPIIERQFSLSLSSSSPAYEKLFTLFSDALKRQSLAGYTAVKDGDGTQVVPVPYWDWQHHLETAFGIISEQANNEEAKFVWPLIQDQLQLCEVAFSPRKIEVRLPYPDLSVVPSYTEAQRRVYMTATLADDSVLTRQMGVESRCVTDPIVPESASDLGDRLILTPEYSAPTQRAEVRELAAQWAQQHNVVVIVPSKHRATTWEEDTSEIHDRESVEEIIARLKSGHVGLVVLVARYDGVDLPDDACRVLILDGLPEAYSPQELVEAVAIDGTDEMGVRQVQRIEQGMGRGIRSTDDYCAVLLLDLRLVERLYSASSKRQLSPATRAQYDLSNKFSGTGRGKSMEFFDEAVREFLARDPKWVQASKQALEGVVYEKLKEVSPLTIAERGAFQHALAGRFSEAKDTLEGAVRGIDDSRLRGWLKQRAAGYLNLVDPENARKLQKSARIDNNYILKVSNDTPYRRVTDARNQADASSTYLSQNYSTAQQLEISVEALLRDLIPSTESGSYKRFEAAVEKIGLVLGFPSSRPDQETGIGPDNFWYTGGNRYWVIESKSEATATEVSREYMEQLSHSADWFSHGHSGVDYDCIPLMIHPSRRPKWDAIPRQGARVMTFEKLSKFREAVRSFVGAVAIDDRYRKTEEVRQNLSMFGLTAREIEQRWTEDFLAPASHS